MQAVILAAGVGSRLGELTRDKPKCLLDIGGTTIIDYQVEVLRSVLGIEPREILVVAGYRAERLDYLRSLGVRIILNPRYREYNNIYSFYIVRYFIKNDFILINGDTIFEPDILKSLGDRLEGTLFVIDNVKTLGDEEMKVIIDRE